MQRFSSYDTLVKATNEKVAERTILFVYKVIPRNRLTSRFLDLFPIECFACPKLVVGTHADTFIHDECVEALRKEDEEWKDFEKNAQKEQEAQEALQRDQKIDEINWRSYVAESEAQERLERESAEMDHDEEDFLVEESDDAPASPSQKEN